MGTSGTEGEPLSKAVSRQFEAKQGPHFHESKASARNGFYDAAEDASSQDSEHEDAFEVFDTERFTPGNAAGQGSGMTAQSDWRTSRHAEQHGFQDGSGELWAEDGSDGAWGDARLFMDSSVRTSIKQNAERQLEGKTRGKDRSDRATVETVLDPKTRMVLFKMLNSGVFAEINGCISTGKEANVYHAVKADGTDLAVKVYKTSILVFKDRDRYVTGDPRFRSYSKSNPRKMVKMWAEKEARNLARLHAAGIRCPRPALLRTHVLVMDFIGVGGVAALRLKDARLPLARLQSMYTEMLVLMRKLYQECRLVHGDLSEYNLLVNEGELFLIDVSQAVDLDHPRALDFLREDAAHVNAFFRRAGIATLNTRELFDFAVDPNINEGNIDATLDRLAHLAASRPIGARQAEEQTADNVFSQTHIPRALEEVADHEEDFTRLAEGRDTEGIYYQTITGMKPDMTGARLGPAVSEPGTQALASSSIAAQEGIGCSSRSSDSSESQALCLATVDSSAACSPGNGQEHRASSDASSSDDDDVSSVDCDTDESPRRDLAARDQPMDREAQKAARKLHKREVKEANRERRKTKMPKHVKKKHLSKGKKRG